jgi:hypothetical protein
MWMKQIVEQQKFVKLYRLLLRHPRGQCRFPAAQIVIGRINQGEMIAIIDLADMIASGR